LEAAAAAYEKLLANGEGSLQVLLNLAVLYWQATDPGLAAAKKLAPEFLTTAARRFPELLRLAEQRFPHATEPRFWTRYIAWADLGEPFGLDECRQLLREDPKAAVPAMHLFTAAHGNEAEVEALELLRSSEREGTTLARYVASVISGVMKRLGPKH
jgi:hypothetical protein